MTFSQNRPVAVSLALALNLALAVAMPAANAAAHDEIPMTFDDGGRPAVEVTLNGQSGFLFAIDTAAQMSMLSPDVVEALDLEPDPHRAVQMHGSAGAVTVPLYPLASLAVGGASLENGAFPVPPAAHDPSAIGHRGLLGHDVFARGQLVLDFDGGTAVFGQSHGPLDGEAVGVELVMGGFALIDVTLNGVAVRALVDTGAAESIGNSALMAALDLETDELSVRHRAAGVSQDVAEQVTGFAGAFGVAGADVTSSLMFADSPIFSTFRMTDRPAMILGMDVLGQLPGFVLDYERSEFAVLQD